MKEAFDFLVIGAQKAGTTALAEYLRQHPELSIPPGKEAPFYSHDARWHGGWQAFARKAFAFAPEATLWGTATPHYMLGSLYEASATALSDEPRPERIVPGRIRRHSPGVKLVAVLRDPVGRAYSHYRMEILRGSERGGFAEALERLLRAETLERARRQPTETSSYVTAGEYGRILEPYFELFGAPQVHVCFTRDLEREPAEVLRRIWLFLGVDDRVVPANLGKRYRVGASRRRAAWLDLDRLQDWLSSRPAVRRCWRALPAPARQRIDTAFDGLSYRFDLWNRSPNHSAEGIGEAVEARLREHYAPDRARLVALLGNEVPWA
jgi:hypothetical protein